MIKTLCLFMLTASVLISAEPPEVKTVGIPPGMKSTMETVSLKITGVSRFVDGDYKYLAYQMVYKEANIDVPVMFPASAKKIGDEVTVMIQKIDMPAQSLKLLQFMVIDFPRPKLDVNPADQDEQQNPPAF